MMANWVGGTFVNRDKKGDPNARPPLVPVPAGQQRAAMEFVIDQSFADGAYGLTPELVRHLTNEKWLDGDRWQSAMQDATWPVHDRIMGLQASSLTMLMNPTTLRRVFDNEMALPADQDALTLAEVMTRIKSSIWSELAAPADREFSARTPLVSSLRRNLQKEHMGRLVDLMMPSDRGLAAFKPVADLAQLELRDLKAEIEKCLKDHGDKLDPYSRAHLTETASVIQKALDSQYIYNAKAIGGGGGGFRITFGAETAAE